MARINTNLTHVLAYRFILPHQHPSLNLASVHDLYKLENITNYLYLNSSVIGSIHSSLIQ